MSFCKMNTFWQCAERTGKLDAIKMSSKEEKKENSDLIYVDKADEILKEAVSLLRKCSPESTELLLAEVQQITVENYQNIN